MKEIKTYLNLRMQGTTLRDAISELEKCPSELVEALKDFDSACREDGLAWSMVYGGIGDKRIETPDLYGEVCHYGVPPAVKDAFQRLQGALIDAREQVKSKS